MKFSIFIIFFLSITPVYAGFQELPVNNSSTSISTLERLTMARDQLGKLNTIIINTPQDIKNTMQVLSRLQSSGKKIEEIVNNYLSVLKGCERTASEIAAKFCQNYGKLQFGKLLKEQKLVIIKLLNDAKNKLTILENKQEDFPLLKNMRSSIIENITLLEESL